MRSLDGSGGVRQHRTDCFGQTRPYAALVLRDPDNVQLELFFMDMSG